MVGKEAVCRTPIRFLYAGGRGLVSFGPSDQRACGEQPERPMPCRKKPQSHKLGDDFIDRHPTPSGATKTPTVLRQATTAITYTSTFYSVYLSLSGTVQTSAFALALAGAVFMSST